jgi:hypothetical protein
MKHLLLLLFTCLSFVVSSCIFKYGKAVMQEARVDASRFKENVYKSQFKGCVILKEYCEECRDKETNPHTYSVKIQLINYSSHGEFWGSSYFDHNKRDSVLTFVITKKIFDLISINDTITKEANRSHLLIKGRSFNWLSGNQYFLFKENTKYNWNDVKKIRKSNLLIDTILISENKITKAGINNKWGIINTKGRILVPIVYDSIGLLNNLTIKNHMVKVKKDGKWGYISEKGKIQIPIAYEYIENYNSSGKFYFKAKKDGKYGLLSDRGYVLRDFIYDYPVGWQHR